MAVRAVKHRPGCRPRTNPMESAGRKLIDSLKKQIVSLTTRAERNRRAQEVYLDLICPGIKETYARFIISNDESDRRKFAVIAYYITTKIPPNSSKKERTNRANQLFKKVVKDCEQDIAIAFRRDDAYVMNMCGSLNSIKDNQKAIVGLSARLKFLMTKARTELIEAGFPEFESCNDEELFRGLCMFGFPTEPDFYKMAQLEKAIAFLEIISNRRRA